MPHAAAVGSRPSSSTCTVELEPARQPSHGSDESPSSRRPVVPPTAVTAKQRWNRPRINTFRVAATFVSFIIMGANDAAYGALIPYGLRGTMLMFGAQLETYYHLTYTVVSLIFLSPLVGYVLAALLSNGIHMRFGRRGIALLGPGCHTVAYVVMALHPPYPVLVLVFILAGFGNGLLDAAWNAWVGNMANANELLGFLHGFYGLGATLSPLIATAMITKAKAAWYVFYYIMTAGAVVETAICLAAFWQETGHQFRHDHPTTAGQTTGRTRQALGNKLTWVVSVFLFGYVGIEVALGGWIVTFMMRVRKGDPFAAGISATGFWLGITVGRVILGFVTPRIGEKLAIIIYLALSILLELLFWLIPQFIVSALAVAFLGFFLGPLFPAAVISATHHLPTSLHIPSIGFASAFGGAGAAVFPFVVGAIAQQASGGVAVLQPVVLALLAVIGAIWVLGIPGGWLGRNQRRGRRGLSV
ncbi:MAG: hypothetical protein M1817_005505 [Caeruleum heppii]|nr:MAG: hypothetical protein M1817_005505 [Caeruleum heppii]